MKRILALLSALVLTVGLLCACGTEPEDTPKETTGESAATTTTVPESANFDYDRITGLYDIEKGASDRPVGIMVPNDSKTIGYQVDIDKADFILESETEGAIPRLLAVFGSVSRLPERFGPIRSARSPFVATARALGIVYVHAGGSGPAKATLKSGVLDHFDALTDGNTFWRDSELKSKIDLVHSVVTTREKLTAKLEKSNYSKTATQDTFLKFGDKRGSDACTAFQLNTTPSQVTSFKYDAETKLYGKYRGKIDSEKPHKSLQGNQIKVNNVIVLYAEKYVEAQYNGTTVYNFRTGSGKGYVFCEGTKREITYTRTDSSLTLKEADGSDISLAAGKTYMILADKNLSEKLIMQ